MRVKAPVPPRNALTDRSVERLWQAKGYARVAGVDEVGRGPLAGPVLAAALILPDDDPLWLPELRDSKLLTPARRAVLAARLRLEGFAYGVGAVSARTIDRMGIAPASREAMRLAVLGLNPAPQALLLDAFALPEVDLPQEPIVHGDAICSAIAAASIVAKVARDRLMERLDRRYPGYGFARNRGYATAEHLEALCRLGPSPIHRYTFAPVRRAAAR